MPRTSALNTLIELDRTRTDDAAKRLGSLNIQSMDLQAKLALLLQYGDEYRARFAVSMQRGLKASDWRNYQEFLDRLDAAIAEQREFLALMNQPQTDNRPGRQPGGPLYRTIHWHSGRCEVSWHARPDPNRSRLMKSSITQPPARRRHNRQNNHSKLHLMPEYGN